MQWLKQVKINTSLIVRGDALRHETPMIDSSQPAFLLAYRERLISVELTFAHVSISCDGASLSGLLTRAPRRQAHQAHTVLQLCKGREKRRQEQNDEMLRC